MCPRYGSSQSWPVLLPILSLLGGSPELPVRAGMSRPNSGPRNEAMAGDEKTKRRLAHGWTLVGKCFPSG